MKSVGLIGSRFCLVVAASSAKCFEPNSSELFSGQQVDHEVGRRVEADQQVRQAQAGLHERRHDAGLALVRTELKFIFIFKF